MESVRRNSAFCLGVRIVLLAVDDEDFIIYVMYVCM